MRSTDGAARGPVSRAARLSLWLLLALLLQFHVRLTVTASVLYDDAFMASVAKNVATGLGYSTSYPGVDLFDPEISTGPVVVFPAALLMRFFGNAYWVPNLAITLAIWATLGLLLWRLRRDCPELPRDAPGLVILAGLILLGTNEFGLLGDLPAAMLAGASFVLFAAGRHGGRARSMTAGLVFGAAVYAKLTVALVLPAIGIVWICDALNGSRENGAGFAPGRQAAWFLLGLSVPAALWQSYQFASVSWSVPAWLDVKAREFAFLAGSQSLSGAGQLRAADSWAGQVTANVAANLGALSSYFGTPLNLVPGIAGIVAVALVRGRSKRVNRLAALLCAAVVCHLAWWLGVSPTGWYRHLLPGIVYAVMLAAVLLAEAVTLAPRRALAGAAGCCLTIALVLPVWYPKAGDLARVFSWNLRRDARLAALLDTRDEVERLARDPSVLLMGCGWWVARDLEYALPQSNNFRDCFRLSPSEASGRRLLLVRNEIFNRDGHEPLTRYQRACERHVIYRREPFVISECPGPPR